MTTSNMQLKALIQKIRDNDYKINDSKASHSYISTFNLNENIYKYNYDSLQKAKSPEKTVKNIETLIEIEKIMKEKEKKYEKEGEDNKNLTQIDELKNDMNKMKNDIYKNISYMIKEEVSNEMRSIKEENFYYKKQNEEMNKKINLIKSEFDNKIQSNELLIKQVNSINDEYKRNIQSMLNKLNEDYLKLNRESIEKNYGNEIDKSYIDSKYEKMIENFNQLRKEVNTYSEDISNIEKQIEINYKNINEKTVLIDKTIRLDLNQSLSRIDYIEKDFNFKLNQFNDDFNDNLQKFSKNLKEIENKVEKITKNIKKIEENNENIDKVKENQNKLKENEGVSNLNEKILSEMMIIRNEYEEKKDSIHKEIQLDIKEIYIKMDSLNKEIEKMNKKVNSMTENIENIGKSYADNNKDLIGKETNNENKNNISYNKKIEHIEKDNKNIISIMKCLEKKIHSIKSNDLIEISLFISNIKEKMKKYEFDEKLKNDILLKTGEEIEVLKEKINQLDDASKEIIISILKLNEDFPEDKRIKIQKDVKFLKEDVKTLKANSTLMKSKFIDDLVELDNMDDNIKEGNNEKTIEYIENNQNFKKEMNISNKKNIFLNDDIDLNEKILYKNDSLVFDNSIETIK